MTAWHSPSRTAIGAKIDARTFFSGFLVCALAATGDVALSHGTVETITLRCAPFADQAEGPNHEFSFYLETIERHPWDDGERYRFDGASRYEVSTDGRARFDRRTGIYALRADHGRGWFVEVATCRQSGGEATNR